MRDFKQQMKTYVDTIRYKRCPYSDMELDREIRSVIWGVDEKPCSYVSSLTKKPGNKCFKKSNIYTEESVSKSTKRNVWSVTAAAAIVAFIAISTTLVMSQQCSPSGILSVDVDGVHFYFACNNGCSAESTIESLKKLLQ